MYDDLMKFSLIAFVSLIVVCGIAAGVAVYDVLNIKTITYTRNVSNVDADKIVFENGDVLFAYNIENFDWVLHKKCIISVKVYYDHILMREIRRVVSVKIVNE